MKSLRIALIVLVCAGFAAASTVFTNQAAFNAATSSLTTVNFSGIVPPGGFIDTGGAITVGGVNFSGPATLFVVDQGFAPVFYSVQGSDSALSDQFGASPAINIGLPGSFLAFSATVESIPSGGNLTITLSDGEVFIVPGPTGGGSFFGVITSVPISSINITGGFPTIGQVQFGAPAVPEPGSLLLLGTGFIGVIGVARRRFNL